MENENIVKKEKVIKVPKKVEITYLRKGDFVYIVTSDGRIVGDGKVEGFVNSYVIVGGDKYWAKGINRKHRKRNNYLVFLMKPKDAKKYAVRDERTGESPAL